MKFKCEACENSELKHPCSQDCKLVDGHCAILMNAGWRPVTVKVAPEERSGRWVPIFVRGGWICSTCVGRYLPKKVKVKRD